MASEPPNRSGWVTGVLAALPACPPFPELTDFEQQALGVFATSLGSGAEAFRRQVAAATVIDRINTAHGFYTRIRVDRALGPPLELDRLGGHFELRDIALGLTVILWFEGGYLDQIEGAGYGTDVLAGRELSQLQFVSGVAD